MRVLLLLLLEICLVAGACAQAPSDAEMCTSGRDEKAPGGRISACTRAIDSGRLSAESQATMFTMRGMEWQRFGDHDRAISDYSEALRVAPQRGFTYYIRGNLLQEMGEHDRAISDFSEAIRIAPGVGLAYSGRGDAWNSKGEYDKAIADYNQAITLKPQHIPAYTGRGDAWQNKGEFDRAIADYDSAIRLDPRAVAARTNRGNAWQSKGELGRALADYNLAMNFDSHYAAAFNSAAWLLATSTDTDFRNGGRAVTLAFRACELTEWKEPNFLNTLAAAYAESGDFGAAIRWQEKAMEFPEFLKTSEHKLREQLALFRQNKPYRE